MNDKYVIKNCPYYSEDETLEGYENMTDCQNIADCILKQIVELCEQYKKDYNTTNGIWLLANNITNLLDIQEVE